MKKKNQKGITLIALIITIVVLLILAGVSIAMLTGESGILTQAVKAKEKTEIANDKEKIQLVYESLRIFNSNNTISKENLLQELTKEKIDVNSVIKSNDKLTIILKNKNIYELENGNVSYMGKQIVYTNEEALTCSRTSNNLIWKSDYLNKVTKIYTKPYIIKLENVIEECDISDKGNKSVVADIIYINDNEYEMCIMANEDIKLKTGYEFFQNFKNVKTITLENFNTTNTQDFRFLFNNCTEVKEIDISSFDTSNVKNMSCMFAGCQKIEEIDLSNFNTSNVENMSMLFSCCYKLKSVDLSNFNTLAVTNVGYMFYETYSLKEINLRNFDLSAATQYDNFLNHFTNPIIKGNQKIYEWIEEKFPKWATCVEII